MIFSLFVFTKRIAFQSVIAESIAVIAFSTVLILVGDTVINIDITVRFLVLGD